MQYIFLKGINILSSICQMSWLHFHCYCYFCSLSPGQWSARRPPLQTSPRASGIAGCSCWCCRCASGCVTFVKPVSVYHFWQHHRRHHSLTDNHLHQNASGISGETFFPICAWPEEQCLGSRVLVGGASQVVSMLIEFHIHITPVYPNYLAVVVVLLELLPAIW